MDFLSVLEIIVVAICAITYGFMLFFKVRGNVLGAVSELIALAEASGLTGAEKMTQVVNGLRIQGEQRGRRGQDARRGENRCGGSRR